MSLSTSPPSRLRAVRAALPSAALVMALAISTIALSDAVIRGVSQGRSPIDEEQGVAWVNVTVSVVHAVGYAVLAGLLASQVELIDAGSRVRRWIRRLLVLALAVLAVMYGVVWFLVDMTVSSPAATVAGAVGGVAFAAMFVLSCALGISLLTRRELRRAAWLLSAQVPLLAVTLLLAAVGSHFAHPAYLEVASALGLALLGRPIPVRTGRPGVREFAG